MKEEVKIPLYKYNGMRDEIKHLSSLVEELKKPYSKVIRNSYGNYLVKPSEEFIKELSDRLKLRNEELYLERQKIASLSEKVDSLPRIIKWLFLKDYN